VENGIELSKWSFSH